ncbi:hypothetical protein AWC15_04190 [Mycobacterium lacus]|uniref:Uncharacterized protein n=1 Tax=Mycobacterium lacus TaxID=169765 RepID=A0A1X1XYY7_9MYCO|nr:hypothetical protein AWC15_04190 [Mycobacterium lacus]BBX95584.1 hypothetical protein MLAC_08780 [Mycobacterium lacus]
MVVDRGSVWNRLHADRCHGTTYARTGVALADLEFGLRGQLVKCARRQVGDRPGVAGQLGDCGDADVK